MSYAHGIRLIVGARLPYERLLLGKDGKKALVLFLYSSNLGLPANFSSSIGIPETLRIRKVITIGLTRAK